LSCDHLTGGGFDREERVVTVHALIIASSGAVLVCSIGLGERRVQIHNQRISGGDSIQVGAKPGCPGRVGDLGQCVGETTDIVVVE
jgi:hypothetical protein